MKARLVNVRLDEEHLRKVRLLRARGIVLSDLVREAIDSRYATLTHSGPSLDVKAIVRDLFERYPDPADLPAREYDVHDAGEAREAVRRQLSRRRA